MDGITTAPRHQNLSVLKKEGADAGPVPFNLSDQPHNFGAGSGSSVPANDSKLAVMLPGNRVRPQAENYTNASLIQMSSDGLTKAQIAERDSLRQAALRGVANDAGDAAKKDGGEAEELLAAAMFEGNQYADNDDDDVIYDRHRRRAHEKKIKDKDKERKGGDGEEELHGDKEPHAGGAAEKDVAEAGGRAAARTADKDLAEAGVKAGAEVAEKVAVRTAEKSAVKAGAKWGVRMGAGAALGLAEGGLGLIGGPVTLGVVAAGAEGIDLALNLHKEKGNWGAALKDTVRDNGKFLKSAWNGVVDMAKSAGHAVLEAGRAVGSFGMGVFKAVAQGDFKGAGEQFKQAGRHILGAVGGLFNFVSPVSWQTFALGGRAAIWAWKHPQKAEQFAGKAVNGIGSALKFGWAVVTNQKLASDVANTGINAAIAAKDAQGGNRAASAAQAVMANGRTLVSDVRGDANVRRTGMNLMNATVGPVNPVAAMMPQPVGGRARADNDNDAVVMAHNDNDVHRPGRVAQGSPYAQLNYAS